jgi:integrase
VLADLPVAEAFEIWFAARLEGTTRETSVRYISKSSEVTYREYAKALHRFFQSLPLSKIHDGHIREYQDARSMAKNGMWTRSAGRNRIRKEVDILIRLMKAADVWDENLKKHYSRLPREFTEIRRTLEPGQQAHLLKVMASRPEWEWVFHYTVLALSTCMSTFELRSIRLRDIDEARRVVNIPPQASKNQYRNRTIPLEDYALRSIYFLKERARRYGAFKPEHYLFPFGIGNRHIPDPERPMTGWGVMDAWKKIRKETGFTKLRPYDLRHMAITNMAEQGVPVHVIMAFAGHICQKMQQHYVAISLQAKRHITETMPSIESPEKPVLQFAPHYVETGNPMSLTSRAGAR